MTTIRWGVIGTGAIAHVFARDMQRVADSQIVAVSSRDIAKAEAFGATYGAKECFGDFQQMVQQSSADVIYVATPNTAHLENCVAALEAGKAVLCEKPFAMTTEQARQIVELARSKNVFCMEAMWMRCLPAIRQLIDRIQQGVIGQVRHLSADFGYPVADDPQSRFYDADLGGGALLDRGVYTLALAQAILGNPANVVSVAEKANTGVDRQSSILLQYESGAIASLSCRLDVESSNEAIISGTKGIIRLDAPFFNPPCVNVIPKSNQPTWPPQDLTSGSSPGLAKKVVGKLKSNRYVRNLKKLLPGSGGESWGGTSEGAGYQFEIAHVNDCLRAKQTESSWMPLGDTLQTMELMDRIQQAW
ncbi:MAG: Gfo/Idh/MocA family oxidoreductase [Planctomycetales bacterium]|nr:Gfo/Idh/MocA family oxidoreductase [Planctomycetales bacterium]